MFLFISRKPRKKDRSRTNRLRSKLKSKNRRRVNRMQGRRLSTRSARAR